MKAELLLQGYVKELHEVTKHTPTLFVVKAFGHYHNVSLGDAPSCSCGYQEQHLSPCVHLVQVLWREGRGDAIRGLFDPLHSKATYLRAYAEVGPMHPFTQLEDLDLEHAEKLLPPVIRKPRGRPKNRRRRESQRATLDLEGRGNKCSKCGGFGHNARSCRQR